MAGDVHHHEGKGRDGLTPRELDLLSLLVRGKTNAEMAAELELTEHTVYSYIEGIKQKLDLTSRAELLRYVRENGIN